MERDTVILFTRNGMGEGPEELQLKLANKYLCLLLETANLPGKILFYTDAVKLACHGSPVIDYLKQLEDKKVELILCQTCLDAYKLTDMVQVGIVGGMGDIIEALQASSKVVSL
jgi:sulfur relay (sulfurtransferase) complex TusBCD TusD component (DsrE family)